MNATPSYEPERAELSRLLPPPAYPELPADRQALMQEELMDHLRERPALRTRKRLALGLATPLALAAAAAIGLYGTSNGSPAAPAAPPAAARGHAAAPTHITNVAYSLDAQPGDNVKITVHRSGATRMDGEQLKKDLARLGVDAEVARTVPRCPSHGTYAVLSYMATPDGHGDYVFTYKREYVANGSLVVFFPIGAPPKVKIKGNTATATGGGDGDFLTLYRGAKPTCTRATG